MKEALQGLMVSQGKEGSQVRQVPLVLMANQVETGNEVLKVHVVHLEHLVHLDGMVKEVKGVHQGHLVQEEPEVKMVLLAHQELQVNQVLLDLLDSGDQMVVLAKEDRPVLQVRTVDQENLDSVVNQVREEGMVNQESEARKGPLALQEVTGAMGSQAIVVNKELVVKQELLVLQVLMALMGDQVNLGKGVKQDSKEALVR